MTEKRFNEIKERAFSGKNITLNKREHEEFMYEYLFEFYCYLRLAMPKDLFSGKFKKELIIDYEMRILTNKIISEEL